MSAAVAAIAAAVAILAMVALQIMQEQQLVVSADTALAAVAAALTAAKHSSGAQVPVRSALTRLICARLLLGSCVTGRSCISR